ncbi:hypothetical protein Tcan_16597 [Toxocara canis]|uniref:Uncharacterized protein n=1 Tax=Toxocara canis TaxID=6265 RepID=A0A0B2V0G1_TOXCA|nr:hypothetical protein Tcan_16597 [Toxocara canis]
MLRAVCMKRTKSVPLMLSQFSSPLVLLLTLFQKRTTNQALSIIAPAFAPLASQATSWRWAEVHKGKRTKVWGWFSEHELVDHRSAGHPLLCPPPTCYPRSLCVPCINNRMDGQNQPTLKSNNAPIQGCFRLGDISVAGDSRQHRASLADHRITTEMPNHLFRRRAFDSHQR